MPYFAIIMSNAKKQDFVAFSKFMQGTVWNAYMNITLKALIWININ